MDNKAKMARKKKVRRPVLLAGAGDGASKEVTSSRKQGKKKNTYITGYKGQAASITKKASPNNSVDKGGDGKARARPKHRHSDKIWSGTGGVEEEDNAVRRSSKFMGVKF